MTYNIKIIYGLIAIFILGITLLLFFYIDALETSYMKLKSIESNRHQMFLKSDELRQTSDDLTKFSRLYVVTENPQYRENYYSILAIRNGEQAVPQGYNFIYWDLLEPIRSKRHPQGHKVKLFDEINILPFTSFEFEKLRQSEAISNQLVKVEIQAFNALNGLYVDAEGQYTINGKKNQVLAIKLLHSAEYSKIKEQIMLPIDEFYLSLDERTYQAFHITNNDISLLFKKIFIGLVLITIVFFSCLFFVIKKLEASYRSVRKLSNIDPLTNVRNRRSFFELSEQAITVAQRTREPLSLLMIDLDGFKKINDSHGHLVGDEILLHFIQAVEKNIRKSDIFSRFGGDEFNLLLHDTKHDGALELAEKIRSFIKHHPYVNGKKSIAFTVSIGVAQYDGESSMSELIHKADNALYDAKETGRNRVVGAR